MQAVLKSLYAAASAGVAATAAAYAQGGGHIGFVAGLTIAGGVLAALGVVWGVPNTPRGRKGAG